MNQTELKNILDAAPVLTQLPDSIAADQMQDLLKHPALPALYGLMLGSRQTFYAALAEARLTNMETMTQAAKIQGIIKGIELFASTLLEQAVPSPDEKEQ